MITSPLRKIHQLVLSILESNGIIPNKSVYFGNIPNIKHYIGIIPPIVMATKEQISQIVQLRGTGHSLEEIAEVVGLSKSAVAYQLQILKKRSKKTGASDVFSSVLMGVMGAAGGIALALLLDELRKE